MNERPKTIFCDIDGVLLKHHGDVTKQHLLDPIVLEGVLDKIKEWDLKGYKIILVTGRRESTRQHTENQLTEAGILYDQLIMGISGGQRVLINDLKTNSNDPTAISFNLERNKGLLEIEF